MLSQLGRHSYKQLPKVRPVLRDRIGKIRQFSVDKKFELFKTNTKWKGIILAICGVVGSCLHFYNASKPAYDDLQSYLDTYFEQNKVENFQLNTLIKNNKFIPRSEKVKEIQSILNRTEADGKYFVIYGAKGVGKSLLVDYCIKDLSGIMKMDVTSITTKQAIINSLATECGFPKMLDPSIQNFTNAFSKPAKDGKLRTVIFEVERAGTSNGEHLIDSVRSLCKAFATGCNCIIVLSEASAIVEFGNDKSRENYIFVDGFTEEEARDFFERRNLKFTESEIADIFARVGKHPGMLQDLSSSLQVKGWTLNKFLEEKVKTARVELAAFPFKPILKALKEHPEGVSPEFFQNLKYEGVDLTDPEAVCSSMKRKNVIVYRKDNKKYELQSKAHETALREYEPIVVSSANPKSG